MAAFNTLAVSRRAPGVAQITIARPAFFNAIGEVLIGKPDAALPQHQIQQPFAQPISRVHGTDETRAGFAAFMANWPASWTSR